jgi:RecB family exonuclease
LRGYIDLWYFLKGELHIIDLKTSSKYSAKDMIHKQRQLILYAYALEKLYPEIKIKLYFNMLKYANRKGKLVERNKLDLFDEYEDGLVQVIYNTEMKKDLEEYVESTYKNILTLNKNDINEWDMGYNPENGFFCKHLCTFREQCLKHA